LKVTIENWKAVERKIRNAGIDKVEYDPKGVLQTIVTKQGGHYDFSREIIRQLQNAGLIEVKLGHRVQPKRS
jgi:hypothetical protein